MSETKKDGAVVRGQMDSNLTPEGKALAKRLGKALADRGGLTCLYLSSSLRTRQTANILKEACPTMEIETPVDDILSWSLGELEGEQLVEAEPTISGLIRYVPCVPAPGRSANGRRGESFDDFRWRALPYIAKQFAEWNNNKKLKLGILTHHRVLRLIKAWLDGGMSPFFDIDTREMTKDYELGKPASVWTVRPGGRGGAWTMADFDPYAKGPLQPGVYVIRHATTALNSGASEAGHGGTS